MANSGSPARFAAIKCNGFVMRTTKPIIVHIAKPAESYLQTAASRSFLSAIGQKRWRNWRSYGVKAHLLNLRINCRPKKDIADIRNNFGIGVTRSRTQLLPFRV